MKWIEFYDKMILDAGHILTIILAISIAHFGIYYVGKLVRTEKIVYKLLLLIGMPLAVTLILSYVTFYSVIICLQFASEETN